MSILWTQVKLTYDNQTLKELTNRRLPGQSTINDTVGEQTVTWFNSWFKRKVREAFDDTDTDHLEVGVQAVYTLLRKFSGKFNDVIQDEVKYIEEAFEDLATANVHKRITPVTDSPLQSTTDTHTAETPERPYFDDERFDSITPQGPPAV